MEKYNNVMIDIETLGISAGCVILSIGAVRFDMSGGTGKQFYKKISLKESLAADFKIESKTLEWWLDQDVKSRKDAFSNGECINHVMESLSDFINEDDYVWANSPSFDCNILAPYFKYINIPWKFYNERDVRTYASIRPDLRDATQWKGDFHNALDDCYNQIDYVCRIHKAIT